VEQLCTHVGVMDQGRLVLQSECRRLTAPTGRVIVCTADADKAAVLLDGQIEERNGDRLVIRHPDAAELNAVLVAQGLRVAEIGPQRRTLEEAVLSVMTHGSDRVGS
jgi:ABC-2 type transport system ATP-binding protein